MRRRSGPSDGRRADVAGRGHRCRREHRHVAVQDRAATLHVVVVGAQPGRARERGDLPQLGVDLAPGVHHRARRVDSTPPAAQAST